MPFSTKSEASKSPVRILHLEDSAADHQLVQLALRHAHLAHALQQVDTLADFTHCLQCERFDLVLADWHLPGFTALDALQTAQQCGSSPLPAFVLLSGAIGEAAAVQAIQQGFADYLSKDELSRLPHVIYRALEMVRTRHAREQAARELAESEQRLAALATHLQTSIEEERAAIAREIHDGIGGALTAVKFDLAWMQRHAQQGPMHQHATSAIDTLQQAMEAAQHIAQGLRPPVLDEGLVAAVRWLADTFERRNGVRTHVTSSSETLHLPPAVQLTAYRTAQEALTNISKHAQAQQVRIELSDREGVLTLEVQDDGCGMTPEALRKPRSFGLKGLQERARRIGGWLDVSSRPKQGTLVVVSIPLAQSPHD